MQKSVLFTNAKGKNGLLPDDIGALIDQARQITHQNVPLLKSLFFVKCICRANRSTRLLEQIEKRYEDSLDIRSLVKTRTNIALILKLLLSE